MSATFAFDYAALSDAEQRAYAEGFLRQFWTEGRLKEIELMNRIAQEADVAGLETIAGHARVAAGALENLIGAIEARNAR